MEKKTALRGYLEKTVNPVFERLIIDLLIDQPKDFIDYSIQWLGDKGRKMQRGEPIEAPKQKESNQDYNPKKKDMHQYDVDSGDEEDDYDEGEFQKHVQKKSTDMRTSVSAEVYGSFNKKSAFIAKKVEKSQEAMQRIEKRLMQAFMFSALDDKERDIVIGAMEEKKFSSGETIIKQGEDGDNLFVVDQGELDCFKKFTKDGEEKYLKTYKPGEAFGELALLYNAPRAATIKAKTESILFSLDRECFNHIVKGSQVKRRERYESVLQKVELLQEMDPYERTHLCDGLKDLKVKAGDYVIKEGEKGDRFYMVDEGKLKATKKAQGSDAQIDVLHYKDGDYFGELALLKDIPRQASVVAETDCILVFLEAGAFKRLMGPIEGLLNRNAVKYEKFLNTTELHEIEKAKFK